MCEKRGGQFSSNLVLIHDGTTRRGMRLGGLRQIIMVGRGNYARRDSCSGKVFEKIMTWF